MDSNILIDIISQLDTGTVICVFPVAAAAIMGASSLLGGLFSGWFGSSAAADSNAANMAIAKMNYDAQMETNRSNANNVSQMNATNLKVARETNETNIRLQNDMNAFNQSMWRQNNEYNSPVNQMKRAQDAGINPNVVFGQPVASSPVQQTSIPNQVTPNLDTFQADSPLMDYKHIPSGSPMLKGVSDLLNVVKEFPFVKERLESMQADNALKREDLKAKEFDNIMKEKDIDDRKNVENLYKSMSLIQNVNDPNDLITPDEYDFLSDDDKKKYNILDENGNSLPNLLKTGFKSRAAFEAWKDIRNVPNFLQNIKTDLTQSRLRYLVDSKKIESDDAVNALVNMDNAAYNRLLYSVKQIKQNLQFNKETWNDRKRAIAAAADKVEGENKFADDSFQTRLHILQMSDEEAMNKVDRNALNLARKWMGDGKLTTGECAKLLLLKAAGFIE